MSVRLDEETERLLARMARRRGLSRSELLRRGIRLLAEEHEEVGETNPYDAIRDLIGRVRNGPKDLSEKTGARFRTALEARRRKRS